jgi:MOSC domain-containing protein YiiM
VIGNGMASISIKHLYISPGHNFFGHHGQPAGTNPLQESAAIECVAGRGVRGDRFFDYKEDYKGQITFFSSEVFERLCHELGFSGRSPGLTRRNVITLGADLILLIGERFSIQGIHFEGVCECKPCYWMDEAIGPGAEEALRGRGGLRARILASGFLRLDPRTHGSRTEHRYIHQLS